MGSMPSIMYAAASGDHDAVMRMLDSNGENANVTDSYGNTALMAASWNGHVRVVRLLVQRNAKVNKANHNNVTALMCASGNGHSKVVEFLVQHKADINRTDNNDHTALIGASLFGHFKVVQVLVEHGAEINKTSYLNTTALIIAAYNGHTDVVEYLLERTDDVNRVNDYDGFTVLHYVARTNNLRLVKRLIQKGANPYLKNDDGQTAIDLANSETAALIHLEVAKSLVRHCTDHAKRNKKKRQRQGSTASGSTSSQYEYNQSSLILAAYANDTKIAKYFLERMDRDDDDDKESALESVNQTNDRGETALHHAARHNNLELVLLLLQRGANPYARDHRGRTALSVATARGRAAMRDFFRTPPSSSGGGGCLCASCGAKLDAIGWFGTRYPLTNGDDVYQGICIRCHPDMVPAHILHKYQQQNNDTIGSWTSPPTQQQQEQQQRRLPAGGNYVCARDQPPYQVSVFNSEYLSKWTTPSLSFPLDLTSLRLASCWSHQ